MGEQPALGFETAAVPHEGAILPDDASRRERLQQNENQLENLKREVRMGANGVVISGTR